MTTTPGVLFVVTSAPSRLVGDRACLAGQQATLRKREDGMSDGIVTRVLERRPRARAKASGIQAAAGGGETSVDRYWGGHTVRAPRFRSRRRSKRYLEWRFADTRSSASSPDSGKARRGGRARLWLWSRERPHRWHCTPMRDD